MKRLIPLALLVTVVFTLAMGHFHGFTLGVLLFAALVLALVLADAGHADGVFSLITNPKKLVPGVTYQVIFSMRLKRGEAYAVCIHELNSRNMQDHLVVMQGGIPGEFLQFSDNRFIPVHRPITSAA